jgi:uncharacterized protein (DUF1800 family)
MGQDLFQPPDVKGWRGQEAWIDTNRLLARQRFLRQIQRDLRAENAAEGGPLFALAEGPAETLLSALPDPQRGAAAATGAAGQDGVHGVLMQAILDPAYQLK